MRQSKSSTYILKIFLEKFVHAFNSEFFPANQICNGKTPKKRQDSNRKKTIFRRNNFIIQIEKAKKTETIKIPQPPSDGARIERNQNQRRKVSDWKSPYSPMESTLVASTEQGRATQKDSSGVLKSRSLG